MTNAQKRALEELWPACGFGSDSSLAGQIAGYENAERSLEIGFGDGDALLSLAKENPMRCFIGIDPHRPGAGRLLLRLQQDLNPCLSLLFIHMFLFGYIIFVQRKKILKLSTAAINEDRNNNYRYLLKS